MTPFRPIPKGLLPILMICLPYLGGARGCGGDDASVMVIEDGGRDMATAPDAHTPDSGTDDAGLVDAGTDASTDDAGSCGATCVGRGTCADPIVLDALAGADGAVHATGTTAGRGNNVRGCQDSVGPDQVFRYTPTEDGYIRIDSAGTTGDFLYQIKLYAREVCGEDDNELACADGFFTDDDVAYMVVRGTHGVPIYIVVDSSDENPGGEFVLNVTPLHRIAEGSACDPLGNERICAAGLVCAGPRESSTCQAGTNLGCGEGVPAYDITSSFVDGTAVIRGNTLLGTDSILGASCDPDGASTHAMIYKVTMPYAALVDANVATHGAAFMPTVYTRTSCTSAPTEHGCGGGDSVFGAGVQFGQIGPVAAGTDLYIFVDAQRFTISGEGPTSGGGFDLTVQLTRLLSEGAACTPGAPGDRCAAGTVCTGTTPSCQDVDLGCGLGVPVADLNPLIVANAATFYGNSSHYADSLHLSCGGGATPEFVHKILMPFAGSLSASADAEEFYPVVAVRSGSCTGGDLACAEADAVTASDVGHLDAGATVYVIVDGGAGDYTLNVRLFPD